MKKFWTNRKFIFSALFVLGLFVIFFVGRSFNAETGQRHLTITANGLQHFRKGLDVSGGTKLVYQISFEKYEEIYKDPAELAGLKKHVENIILKNIDSRVSKLGVSDYKAYTQILNDQPYIVVEIGGIADLDQAKEIIGKTVELEFRMPSTQKPTEKSILERKLKAATLKEEIMKNPELIKKLAENRGAENIFFNEFTGVTLEQLPDIYKKNQRLLDSVEIGEVSPDLIDGLYATIEQQNMSGGVDKTDLKGFTFFIVNKRTAQDRTTVTPSDVVQVAEGLGKTYVQENTTVAPSMQENTYAYVGKNLVFNAGEVAKDQNAYNIRIVKVKKSVKLGATEEEIKTAEDEASSAIATVKSQIKTAKEFTLTNVQEVYNDWAASEDVKKMITAFDENNKEAIQEYKQLNDTYIVYISDRKEKSEKLYAQLVVNNVDQNTFEGALKKRVVYDIQDVFVQDRETWTLAMDPKENVVLNGAYFKFANVSSSDMGQPTVVINLDDKGKNIFCNISEVNIGKQMAIFIGGELLTAPTIQSKICGGSAQIDGNFTAQSAKELSDSLNEGALPAPLILMQEEKISPTLGANALNGAFLAALVGIIAIFFMMRYMYGIKKATISVIILVEHIVVLGLFMKLSDYALSLSGIAAVILSIGMAMDASILIFERTKEELDQGKSMASSIHAGHERSWTAIRDGNICACLIALVLFAMGSNVFKGFGAMLLVTTILTLIINFPLNEVLMKMFYLKKENK